MALNLPSSLSDHPSLVGIIRFPTCTYEYQQVKIPTIRKNSDNRWESVTQTVFMATSITRGTKESGTFTIPKTDITDFYPYTYYVLADGETEPLIMYPQYLPNSVTIKGKFSLSNQPVERYYPSSYKGDTSGNIYNITNTNQMMLPTATNEGINYMNANSNTMAQSRKSQITGNVLNAIDVGARAMATGGLSLIGGGVTSIIGGISEIQNANARNKDISLTPSTISSFGTPSTRVAFENDSVRLIKYSVDDTIKSKVRNFCNRYGNKYNNYATINLKTYKGYIKFIAPNIDSSIDNIYINKIRSILERGVFIE